MAKSYSPRVSVNIALVAVLCAFAGGYVLGARHKPTTTEPVAKTPPKTVEVPSAAPASPASPAPVKGDSVPSQPIEAASKETTPAPPVPAEPEPDVLWPARHLIVTVPGRTLDEATVALLKELRPGGVLLTAENITDRAQTLGLVAQIKQAVGLGTGIADLPLIMVSQEGGQNNPLNIKEAPTAASLGKAGTEAATNAGRSYAQACSAAGIGVILAPVLDIFVPKTSAKTDEWRCFGTNQATVSSTGLAFADGIIEGGVIPVVKSFPGAMAATRKGKGSLPTLNQDFEGLAQVMFPFSEAVTRGVPGVLVGHVAVPALEVDQKVQPATFSPVLVQALLRERWHYNGVIVSDDLGADVIAALAKPGDAAVYALAAGCDAAILRSSDPDTIRAVCASIEAATKQSAEIRTKLKESQKRLDSWRTWLDRPTTMKPAGSVAAQDSESPASASETVAAAPAPPTPTPTAASPAIEEQPATPAPAAVQPAAEKTEPVPPAPEPSVPDVRTEPAPQPAKTIKVTHTVAPEQTLSHMAAQYKVSTRDLMAWNGLTDPTIKSGTSLVVYLPEDSGASEKAQDAPSAVSTTPAGTELKHVVQKGETLWKISSHYGVKMTDVVKWNSLKSTNVQAGQKLTVYAPAGFVEKETVSTPAPPAVTAPLVSAPAALPAPESTPAPAPVPTVEAAPVVAPVAAPVAAPEPAVSPTPAPTAGSASRTMRKHVVIEGETVESIAAEYGVSKDDLASWNTLDDGKAKAGQELTVYLETAE